MSEENRENYELVEPFDIDHGELDGVRPQIIFCLGYEFRQLSELLETGEPLNRTIHAANASRVMRMCIRRKRIVRVKPCPGLAAEWFFLEVD